MTDDELLVPPNNASGGDSDLISAADVTSNLHVLSIHADSLVEGGQYDKAAHIYRFMSSRSAGFSRWRIGLGYCLLCSHRYGEALAELSEVKTTGLKEDYRQAIDLMINLARSKRQELSAKNSKKLLDAFRFEGQSDSDPSGSSDAEIGGDAAPAAVARH